MNKIYANYFNLSILIISSIISGLIFSKLGIWLSKNLDIIDYPGKNPHNIHEKPLPRAAGIALILSVILNLFFFGYFPNEEIQILVLSCSVIFAFAIIDDRFGMKALVKLAGQVLAVTILIIMGARVRIFENPDSFVRVNENLKVGLDIFLTYFWMIGITNAFNMIDSIDGLVIGLARIYSGCFILMTIISNQPILVIISVILFGACWGISFYNQRPARLFLGDSGAQSIGFFLAVIAILYRPINSFQSSSWLAPIIFFSAPIFDTTLVSLSRFRKGIPFYKAGLDHTYHRLISLGWNQNYAVSVIHLLAGMMGFVSIAITYMQPLIANGFFIGWLVIFFGLISTLEKKYSPL